MATVTGWARAEQLPLDEVVSEVGAALRGHRRQFLALLGGPAVARIVAEHRDRLCRLDSEHAEAARAAQGRRAIIAPAADECEVA